MKRTSFFTILLLGASTQAQMLGTKSDVGGGPTSSSSTSIMPFLQMMMALGIVLVLLKFVLPKVATKLSKRLVTPLNSSLKVEESAQFAGGALYVVQARSKTVLLSVSSSGVQFLADITEPTVSTPVVTPAPLFMDILKKEVDDPALQPFAIVNEETSDRARAQLALDRLERLVG